MKKIERVPLAMDKIEGVPLKAGSHGTPEEGMCVMEAVAYVRGLPHSDHPPCVCPAVAAFLRQYNDLLPDDATRTRLLVPLIPIIVGTADGREQERRAIFVDRAFQIAISAGLSAHAPDRAKRTAEERAVAVEMVRQAAVQAVIDACSI